MKIEKAGDSDSILGALSFLLLFIINLTEGTVALTVRRRCHSVFGFEKIDEMCDAVNTDCGSNLMDAQVSGLKQSAGM